MLYRCLLFFIIVLLLSVLFREYMILAAVLATSKPKKYNEKIGGVDKNYFDISIDKIPTINPNWSIIVDGNNIIHSYLINQALPITKFNLALDKVSNMLIHDLPIHKIHIVVKNNENKNENKNKNNNEKKFINFILHLSKKYPSITYHLALDINNTYNNMYNNTYNNHIYKARDDLLTIWLRKNHQNSYMLSNDLYRDFMHMHKVSSFMHYTIRKNIITEYKIEPNKIHNEIQYFDKPNIGNHLLFELNKGLYKHDKKANIHINHNGYMVLNLTV